MKKTATIYLLGTLMAVGVFIISAANAANVQKTLRNLQSAYNGESNAHVRYLAFARQADKEGYAQVAVLFRAAARAEQIHLTNHAAVIRQLGGIPKATIETPIVRLTKQNLEQSASKGEAYERDTMYPRFIKTAETEAVPAAVKTFEEARDAEAQHYKLFEAALQNLEHMRLTGAVYYVCSVNGYTAENTDMSYCPDGEYETIK